MFEEGFKSCCNDTKKWNVICNRNVAENDNATMKIGIKIQFNILRWYNFHVCFMKSHWGVTICGLSKYWWCTS